MSQKNLNGIFIYIVKVIYLQIFIGISFHQLLSAVMKKKFNGIFIHTLKVISVPNFSSLGWFSFSSAVNSCYQLLTADQLLKIIFKCWILILVLMLVFVPNFSLIGWLGAALESVTDRQLDIRMPSENRANFSPAWLVSGSELSNLHLLKKKFHEVILQMFPWRL